MGRRHEQGRIKTLEQGTLYQSVRWKKRTDFFNERKKNERERRPYTHIIINSIAAIRRCTGSRFNETFLDQYHFNNTRIHTRNCARRLHHSKEINYDTWT